MYFIKVNGTDKVYIAPTKNEDGTYTMVSGSIWNVSEMGVKVISENKARKVLGDEGFDSLVEFNCP